jgi:hypothetical protein
MTRFPTLIAFAAGLAAMLGAALSPARAQEAELEPWRFNATAYGWLTSISGSTTAKGQTFDVNAGFFDLLRNSSSIAAFDGYIEANKGRVGVYGDLVWSNLGFSKSAARYRNPVPGLTVSGVANVQLNLVTTIVEVGGVYEFARWSHSPTSFTAFDGLLGIRYWNNAVEAQIDTVATANAYDLGLERSMGLTIARDNGLRWIDPVVGFRLRHQFTPTQSAFLRGDIGGFGLGSSFSWQAVGVYSYGWKVDNHVLAAMIGYRALAANYSEGWGLNTRGMDIIMHGPLIGLSVKF